MYINIALDRLNKIIWDNVDTKGDYLDGNLFYKFIINLSEYFKKNNIKNTTNPMMRIFMLFCHDETIISKFSCVFKNLPENRVYHRYVVWCYIQLALDIDNDEAEISDFDLFEPLLYILERGGAFYRGEHSSSAVEVLHAGYFPLSKGWDECTIGTRTEQLKGSDNL